MKIPCNINLTITVDEKHPYFCLGKQNIKNAVKYAISEYFDDPKHFHEDVDSELFLVIRDTFKKKEKQEMDRLMDDWKDDINKMTFLTKSNNTKITLK